MRVQLVVAREALQRRLVEELRGEGATLVDEGEAFDALVIDETHPEARDRVEQVRAARSHPFIVLLGTLDRVRDPWNGVSAVVLDPPRPGELGARIAMLMSRGGAGNSRREALLAAAVEVAGDIIEIATPDTLYEYVNPAFTQVMGFELEEVVGKTPAQVIRSDMHDAAYFKKIDETLKAGKRWDGLLISRARDDRMVYLECIIAPMRNAYGEITHHMAVKRDITARIQAETELRRKQEELEQARDAALEASRAKSQFLANMSHELRTPLNAIIGYSEMLMEDAEDDGDQGIVDDLGKIHKSGQHLRSLIDDVLDISKIEAGAMKLHIEAFDLETAINGVVATIEPLCLEQGNRLRVQFGDDLGFMRADVTKVRQTLMNLLGNAAKFTEDGEIELRVSKTTEGGEPFYAFEIRDSGIGIDAEQLRRLFRPFVQADGSTSRKYGGTGLGLAISLRFCEMMGGRIDVTSEMGKGSVFRVLLPRMVQPPPSSSQEIPAVRPRPERAERLVLVIDDDPSIRELLTRKLAKQGFRVEVANDGAHGLVRARELQPAAIVLDVMMPELDGWAVLTELKGDPATVDIPVVLLTILKRSELGFALGAVDYLIKPVQTDRLVTVLHRHCRTDSAEVLIVDDDANNRELMRRTMESAGYVVFEAPDGERGIAAMLAQPPDLVVLDLMMPVLDGFSVLERMRSEPSLCEVPVVVVTAKDLSSDDRAMLRGARAVFEREVYGPRELADAVAERVCELVVD